MASNNYKDHLLTERVKLKKVFYVIRPVLAARWAAKKQTPPPVSFHELLAGSELSPELRSTVDHLYCHYPDAKWTNKTATPSVTVLYKKRGFLP